MINIFTALPWLKPFDMLGTDDERNRIATLFSEENGHIISEYFSRRAKIGQMDVGQIVFHNLPKAPLPTRPFSSKMLPLQKFLLLLYW